MVSYGCRNASLAVKNCRSIRLIPICAYVWLCKCSRTTPAPTGFSFFVFSSHRTLYFLIFLLQYLTIACCGTVSACSHDVPAHRRRWDSPHTINFFYQPATSDAIDCDEIQQIHCADVPCYLLAWYKIEKFTELFSGQRSIFLWLRASSITYCEYSAEFVV